MSGLTKVFIYFWGQDGRKIEYRAEYVIDGYLNYEVGCQSSMRILLAALRSVHRVDLPKVSWKKIIGTDELGGDCYKWVRP